MQYSFGIIDWSQFDINAIDTHTRKLLCQNKIFYKDQSHARLYIPRAKGGLGLIEVDATNKATITSLAQYILSAKGPYAAILKIHYSIASNKSLITLAEAFLKPHKLEKAQGNPTTTARKTQRKFIEKRQKENVDGWKRHKRAGTFANRIEEEEIDKNSSLE